MNEAAHILVCGPNWLGDSVMCMPAIQLFRREHPACRLTLLVKRGLTPLWALHADVDEVLPYDAGTAGTIATSRILRCAAVEAAYIFPNSFRSALLPFLAGVPRRRGMRGHWRALLLTDIVAAEQRGGTGHQSMEYLDILELGARADLPSPRLDLPADLLEVTAAKFHVEAARPCVALMPGAARGASKRWPEEHFAAVGRWLVKQGLQIVVLGSGAEVELCRTVAAAIGAGATNLAGATSLTELAAILHLCRTAVTNDSGGMHLAAAAGLNVVAVFGMTDPGKTGPLGAGHRIVAEQGVAASRDIARNSREAVDCLRRIQPGRVIASLNDLLCGVSR